MKAIGVRELKAQLSRYLRDVAAGEIVLVTDRGRVVAELRAPGAAGADESDFERRLRLLSAKMPLTIGRPRPGFVYRESPVKPAPQGTASRLLDAERDEHDRLR